LSNPEARAVFYKTSLPTKISTKKKYIFAVQKEVFNFRVADGLTDNDHSIHFKMYLTSALFLLQSKDS
jgi:hypothetical protein